MKRLRLYCRMCGRLVATYVAKGGDGSERKPYPHKHPFGQCEGAEWLADWGEGLTIDGVPSKEKPVVARVLIPPDRAPSDVAK